MVCAHEPKYAYVSRKYILQLSGVKNLSYIAFSVVFYHPAKLPQLARPHTQLLHSFLFRTHFSSQPQEEKHARAGEVAQKVRIFATKPDNLCQSSRTQR